MKILIKLFLILLFAVPILAQEKYTATISAADSLGSIIRLGRGDFISSVSTTDSLTGITDSLADNNKTLKFYVFRGDTTGYYQDTTTTLLEAGGWTLITNKDDASTDYSVTIARYKNTPIDFQIMAHFVGTGRSQGQYLLYIVPYISGSSDAATTGGVGTDATLTFDSMRY